MPQPEQPVLAQPAAGAFPQVQMGGAAARTDIAVALAAHAAFLVLPYALSTLPGPRLRHAFGGRWLVWAVAGELLSLTTVALILWYRQQGPATIGLNRVAVSRVLLTAGVALPACYVAGILGAIAVAAFSPAGLAGVARQRGQFLGAIANMPPTLVVPVSLFVGLCEEVFFRGFLLSRLRALSSGNLLPVVLSSAIFGGMHYVQGLGGVGQTMAVGFVLAILVVRTRTLWPAILTHATIDGVSLTLTILFADRFRSA